MHRSIATHLYSEALVISSAVTLLDTLLVLLNLDVSSLALPCEQVETNELL